ncbi:MAG: phage tail protein [Clostridia bacterium]|nr:phage tail protein [Clostridia bacterium]
MYIVKIVNNGITTEMHGERQKLASGSIVKGINTIDAFTCSLFPNSPAFNNLHEFTTLVNIFNTKKNRYEFYGRLLYSNPSMSESGLITKDLTFESYLGFLCDSQQPYVAERNWTVRELLTHIVDVHNSQLESYKHFVVGEITVTDPNDNLYLGIQRKNTFETIKEKLIDNLGGELQLRVVDGINYLDYLERIGEQKATKIALSHNMKSIAKEKDPSDYITRLIPLGAKLSVEETITDDEGETTTQTVQTEERLEITSVNGGVNYIDDTEAIAEYGLHIGYVEWDDVTEPSILLTKARAWLADNNKVKIKYSINTLDLSLLGLDIDDFDVGNSYPVENSLLGIDDIARVIKKNIDVCEEVSSAIEVGENFKTIHELIVGNQKANNDMQAAIVDIRSNYATNQVMTDETVKLTSLIEQSIASVLLTVSETYTTKEADEEYKETVSAQFGVLSDEIIAKFTTATEQIVNVDGDLQTKFAELYKYISFSGDNAITIGGSSGITLTVDNDNGIIFSKDGVQFGWWDGVDFHTGNIVVEVNERAQFGNFAYVPRSDGSLAFLKVKG